MTSIDPRHLFVGYVDEIRLVGVEVEVEARGLACGLKSLREICPCVCVCVLHGAPVAPTWRCSHPWLKHGAFKRHVTSPDASKSPRGCVQPETGQQGELIPGHVPWKPPSLHTSCLRPTQKNTHTRFTVLLILLKLLWVKYPAQRRRRENRRINKQTWESSLKDIVPPDIVSAAAGRFHLTFRVDWATPEFNPTFNWPAFASFYINIWWAFLLPGCPDVPHRYANIPPSHHLTDGWHRGVVCVVFVCRENTVSAGCVPFSVIYLINFSIQHVPTILQSSFKTHHNTYTIYKYIYILYKRQSIPFFSVLL